MQQCEAGIARDYFTNPLCGWVFLLRQRILPDVIKIKWEEIFPGASFHKLQVLYTELHFAAHNHISNATEMNRDPWWVGVTRTKKYFRFGYSLGWTQSKQNVSYILVLFIILGKVQKAKFILLRSDANYISDEHCFLFKYTQSVSSNLIPLMPYDYNPKMRSVFAADWLEMK